MRLGDKRTIWPAGLGLSAALALAGCASKNQSVATYPTPVQQAETATLPPPAYVPTRKGAEAIWALRSALNVAALSCKGSVGGDYNRMLKLHKALLADAYASEQARYRQANGAKWQNVQDRDMTRLYNLYANQPSRSKFCTDADLVASQALGTPPEQFAGFAAIALGKFETAELRAR